MTSLTTVSSHKKNRKLKQGKKLLKSFLYHFFVIAFGYLMIYPILWMVFASVKDNSEIFKNAGSLLPTTYHFENYAIGWKGFASTSFAVFFKNSFITAILSTIGAVASSALVAYGFARIKFAGKKLWFALMMVTMMLPFQVVMIPQFVIFHKLNWINSFKPIIIPQFLGQPFFIFLMVQFIQGIPGELDQSAKIDGCGRYSIFYRIILPLLSPALITSTIFSFYWRWDDFFAALLYLNKPKLYTIPLALRMFADPASVSNWGAMLAMATLSLIPVFVIFFIFQRYLVEGISTTGLKA